MSHLTVSGSFDDIRAPQVRYLEDMANRGKVHLLLWSDELFRQIEKREPKFPLAERQYFLESIRYVDQVSVVNKQDGSDAGPFVEKPPAPPVTGRKKVIVTGCYDYLHTGHVRFFEEVSEYGDVYAVVGHDANIELLKGKGHPQFPQEERRFLVGSLKFVKQALISTGNGWMDAEPEIARIKPDIYAVNEDGDKPEKREFCQKHGIEYLVLKRLPKPGLKRRSSTDLRGF
jgi:cytidyltransferase-like protein